MSTPNFRRSALRASKNTMMLLFGTVTRLVAGFAFILYCADKLNVEGFGRYSIAIHYFELFLSLTATAVGILLTRDMARWPKHGSELLTCGMVGVVILCALTPPVIWSLSVLFKYSDLTQSALLLACVALFPAALASVFEAAFVARERAEWVTAGTAIEALLRLALSFWVLAQGLELLALISVVIVSRLVLFSVYCFGLARIGLLRWRFRRKIFLRTCMRWRVFAAENWQATINTNLDVIILSWLAGEVATGLYNAAWKIVRLGSVVAKSYTTAIFPVMSRLHAESKVAFARLYRHSLRVMSMVALPSIAGITVLAERLIDLLFKPEYAAAVPVLQILIWVLLLEFLNPFLSHLLFAQGRQQRSMNVATISLCVNTIATYFCVRYWEAAGAAASTLLGGVVALVAYACFALPRADLVNTLSAVVKVAVAATVMGVCLHLIHDANWLLLGLVAVGVYVPLLFLLGAIRIADVQFFRATFLSGAAS